MRQRPEGDDINQQKLRLEPKMKAISIRNRHCGRSNLCRLLDYMENPETGRRFHRHFATGSRSWLVRPQETCCAAHTRTVSATDVLTNPSKFRPCPGQIFYPDGFGSSRCHGKSHFRTKALHPGSWLLATSMLSTWRQS